MGLEFQNFQKRVIEIDLSENYSGKLFFIGRIERKKKNYLQKKFPSPQIFHSIFRLIFLKNMIFFSVRYVALKLNL